MERRRLLKLTAGSGLAGLISKRELAAQEQVRKAVRGMPSPKIRDIRVIETAPAGLRLESAYTIQSQGNPRACEVHP